MRFSLGLRILAITTSWLWSSFGLSPSRFSHFFSVRLLLLIIWQRSLDHLSDLQHLRPGFGNCGFTWECCAHPRTETVQVFIIAASCLEQDCNKRSIIWELAQVMADKNQLVKRRKRYLVFMHNDLYWLRNAFEWIYCGSYFHSHE